MKAELSHLEVHPGEEGGVVVKHVFKPNRGRNQMDMYKEPEMHPFGKDEGGEALAHIAKHAGIKEEAGEAEEERDEEKIDPGIHEKVAKMEKAEK